jgi:hypothetical protein
VWRAHKADDLISICESDENVGASTSHNPAGLPRPVTGIALPGYGPMAYCFTHGNDPSGSIPLEYLSNCQLSEAFVKGYQMIVIELGRKLSEAFT